MKRNLPFALTLIACFAFSAYTSAQNVLDNKTYRVTGYKNGNASITSTSNYREVIPPLSMFIPDAFTPNGDGINDTFGVKGEGIQNFSMRIYNRWGEVLYESSNPKQQWDGTFKGKPVSNDTYVYQLSGSGIGSGAKTGSVTLVR